MIFDNIKNYRLYTGGKIEFKEAFELIVNKKYEKAPGRYELDGGLFYMVQSYETKPVSEGKFEAHRKFIDLQYIASGKERHDAANISGLTVRDDYNAEKDIIFYNESADSAGCSTLILNEGFFAIYYPEDGHMPNLRIYESSDAVTKIIVKIPYTV